MNNNLFDGKNVNYMILFFFIFILYLLQILIYCIYESYIFSIRTLQIDLIWISIIISSRSYRRLSITRDQWSAFYVHFNGNKSILGDSLLPHLPLPWLSRSNMRCNNYCSHPASFIISITLKLKGEQIPML